MTNEQKVEHTIDSMVQEKVSALCASIVADRVVAGMPNISTVEYEHIMRIAGDSLARRFDPSIRYEGDAEAFAEHADQLEAWHKARKHVPT